MKKGILVVSFGTSHLDTMEKTIQALEDDIEEAFPEYRVYRAFTSGMILRKLEREEGIKIDTVEKADILLIVGTSLQVYPAAGLYRYAGYDTPIYIIDPKDVPVSDSRITHIREVATKGMEIFKNILNSK